MFGQKSRQTNGINNGDGFVDGILFPAPPSINWRCGKPKHSTQPRSIANWDGQNVSVLIRCVFTCIIWRGKSTRLDLNRVDQYLGIADKHYISTLFVFFDDCWNPTYQAGKQPDPKPGIHNSGWVRDPGDKIHEDTTLIRRWKNIPKMLTHFSNDKRIVLWDLYNEPGNSDYGNKSMPFCKRYLSGDVK